MITIINKTSQHSNRSPLTMIEASFFIIKLFYLQRVYKQSGIITVQLLGGLGLDFSSYCFVYDLITGSHAAEEVQVPIPTASRFPAEIP